MKSLINYLAESKNTHMTHIEDLILDGGVKGARQAILALRSLRDMLSGNAKAPMDVTVKWDGAPALFAGEDPTDGQFFVAKKGIFAKNPKVYKNHADIDADTSGDLNKKLKYFIQVNIGNESQKSGIPVSELDPFYNYCTKEKSLNVIGLMVIPPNENDSSKYFASVSQLNKSLALQDLSMGMSADYMDAVKNGSTFLRIGSSIFGPRS